MGFFSRLFGRPASGTFIGSESAMQLFVNLGVAVSGQQACIQRSTQEINEMRRYDPAKADLMQRSTNEQLASYFNEIQGAIKTASLEELLAVKHNLIKGQMQIAKQNQNQMTYIVDGEIQARAKLGRK